MRRGLSAFGVAFLPAAYVAVACTVSVPSPSTTTTAGGSSGGTSGGSSGGSGSGGPPSLGLCLHSASDSDPANENLPSGTFSGPGDVGLVPGQTTSFGEVVPADFPSWPRTAGQSCNSPGSIWCGAGPDGTATVVLYCGTFTGVLPDGGTGTIGAPGIFSEIFACASGDQCQDLFDATPGSSVRCGPDNTVHADNTIVLAVPGAPCSKPSDVACSFDQKSILGCVAGAWVASQCTNGSFCTITDCRFESTQCGGPQSVPNGGCCTCIYCP